MVNIQEAADRLTAVLNEVGGAGFSVFGDEASETIVIWGEGGVISEHRFIEPDWEHHRVWKVKS